MKYISGSSEEYDYIKLTTDANSVYNLDVIQAVKVVNDYVGRRIVAYGDWGTRQASTLTDMSSTIYGTLGTLASGETSALVTVAGNRTLFCIDGTTGTTGACAGLSLTSRAGVTPGIDATGALTVQWVAGTMITKMSAF